jgi:ribose 5-phosphate isomerase B
MPLTTLVAMRIAIASDHAGFRLKEDLKGVIAAAGHAVTDLGTHDETPVDYPDYAAAVGRNVVSGRTDRGIIVCGSGAGAAIAANKITGVRCATCHDDATARNAREHNDANVLSLGARVVARGAALRMARIFLDTSFGGGRHERRVRKIEALERGG